MKIAVGCDHAGVEAKNEIIKHLTSKGYETVNFGTDTTDSVDYPDIALPVALAVKNGECTYGILICGTGVGIGISANKVRGIRCALCSDAYTAELTRRHNDANMISMGARVLAVPKMIEIVDKFLSTDFEGGRHQKRIDKITEIERLQDTDK
ncbi:MAG: ribose 5-phosphate isomerase B [Christensenellaceae bacterium]